MSKSKSFADLKAEIAALTAQADEARRKEIAEVVAGIKNAIAMYGLTAADLGFRGLAAAGKPGKPIKTSVPKYRDPKSGKTWTGHGKPPNWIAKSRNRDAFLIDPSMAAPAPAAAAPAAPAKAPVKAAAKRGPAAKKAPAKKAAAKKAPRKNAKGAAAEPASSESAAA